MKGIIALDIDGTITNDKHLVPDDVYLFLQELHSDGWALAFLTGRTFSYTQMTIEHFQFPYYLAVQNGADILSMPAKQLLVRKYLNGSILKRLDEIYQTLPEDYIIYAGVQGGDYCIYRRASFSEQGLHYLDKLKKLTKQDWKEEEVFDLSRTFPLIKCFGSLADMEKIEQSIPQTEASCFIIRDVVDPSFYLALITAPGVDKGTALNWIIKHSNFKGPVIAAGDDGNDLPLSVHADVFIAMHKAPLFLKSKATLIAPDKDNGIILALKQAIATC